MIIFCARMVALAWMLSMCQSTAWSAGSEESSKKPALEMTLIEVEDGVWSYKKMLLIVTNNEVSPDANVKIDFLYFSGEKLVDGILSDLSLGFGGGYFRSHPPPNEHVLSPGSCFIYVLNLDEGMKITEVRHGTHTYVPKIIQAKVPGNPDKLVKVRYGEMLGVETINLFREDAPRKEE